ncbi:MAG: (d)CMP kinase [Phycisphaera sp.]|nr:(d)CMP kinase [Phycisphaera sp.]
MSDLIITLDGPAGSGKSSVARKLAQRLGLEFLDTGAMYRGITAQCLDHGVNPTQEPERVIEVARSVRMRFAWGDDPPRLIIDGRDVTHRLRDPDVTVSVSDVAMLAGVREVMVRLQQRIGAEHSRLVTEGRDQGSVVFPDARVKFYLDASAKVRAGRRARQLREAGREADEAVILAQIIQRDQKDSTRKDGPLICPPDAVRIDTSEMTLEEVLNLLEAKSREKAGRAIQV